MWGTFRVLELVAISAAARSSASLARARRFSVAPMMDWTDWKGKYMIMIDFIASNRRVCVFCRTVCS